MKGQFKNPLPGKGQSGAQENERLTEGAQPAAPGDQSQGNTSPTGQTSPKRGMSLFLPPWPGTRPETPYPANMTEQATIKQPSLNPSAEAYVQGQHGRYSVDNGPAGQLLPPAMNNGPLNIPPVQGGPSMFPSAPNPGALAGNPMGIRPATGALAGNPMGMRPATGALVGGPGFNTLNQSMPGTPFAQPQIGSMVAVPPAPNAFNPTRPLVNPAPLETGWNDSGRKISRDLLPSGKGKKRKKHHRVPIWARVVISILVMMIVALGGGYWYYETNYATALGSIIGQNVQRAPGEGNPNDKLTGGILSGPRINILLLGSDTDEKFQGTYIAQTDIVVTIDPASKTVGMLSIPRDFFIPVPGAGMRKLDEAYGLGGVDLSRRTLLDDFGISINYYAWIGLDGFIKVINEVGGVDVDVLHPIVDDNYPDDVGANANDPNAFKRLYLAPGPQHLDGETALEYVRSRHADLKGDFGRSVRQQQVISALKTKLANPDIFSKLSAIANDMTGYLKTDMQLTDILSLMGFAKNLDINKINKLVLGPPYSNGGTAPVGTADAGASIVVPNCSQIIPAIQSFLGMGSSAACNVSLNGGSSNSGVASTNGQQNAPLADSLSNGNSSTNMFSTVSASLSSGPGELYGMRSLLDLLFMATFESTDVLQV